MLTKSLSEILEERGAGSTVNTYERFLNELADSDHGVTELAPGITPLGVLVEGRDLAEHQAGSPTITNSTVPAATWRAVVTTTISSIGVATLSGIAWRRKPKGAISNWSATAP